MESSGQSKSWEDALRTLQKKRLADYIESEYWNKQKYNPLNPTYHPSSKVNHALGEAEQVATELLNEPLPDLSIQRPGHNTLVHSLPPIDDYTPSTDEECLETRIKAGKLQYTHKTIVTKTQICFVIREESDGNFICMFRIILTDAHRHIESRYCKYY